MADEIKVTVTPKAPATVEIPATETPTETSAPETTAILEQQTEQHEENILASAVVSEQVQNVDTRIKENQSWLENAFSTLTENQSRLTTSIMELVSEMRLSRNPTPESVPPNPSTELTS